MSVQFEGAVVKEQGETFGILVVKPPVLNHPSARAEMRSFGTRAWGRMPIMLMTQDRRGVPTYQGRRDIVRFLANLDMGRVPWKRWTLS